MNPVTLSPNTQAILLLTAPLIIGKGKADASLDLLRPSEYQRLAQHLVAIEKRPCDLLSSAAEDLIAECNGIVPASRVRALLSRGLLLSQAVEHWQTRGIWVVSRADTSYPKVLKAKLAGKAPAVLYGCGNIELLRTTGLAVVGSRNVSDDLMSYAEGVGALAARAGCKVVSGGARGVDRAAMDGSLEAGGFVVGVLAEDLEREAMNRKNRDGLRSGRLVLVSEYDPSARFSIGHAMQRNKLIYAFADHALIVNSDLDKGGTWAGAVEQLEKLRFAEVFVRSSGPSNPALDALIERGARPWPNGLSPDHLLEQLTSAARIDRAPLADKGSSTASSRDNGTVADRHHSTPSADALFQAVRDIMLPVLEVPRSEAELAELLDVTEVQVREWLRRLLDLRLVLQSGLPKRYHRAQEGGRAEASR